MSASAQVQDRVDQAARAYKEAELLLHRALAEQARLALLEFVDSNPAIKGLRFESEYEYDDEGGYFLNDSIYPLVADDQTEIEVDPDYEFYDEMQHYGHAALALLCDVPTDSYSGEVTIEQARDRRF